MKTFFQFIFFFFTGFITVNGQDISFSHLTVEQGLSQNSVLTITQDARGFMWFGSRYGLNRYDGHHFTSFQNNPSDSNSISDSYIVSLLCDSRQTLWVGTEKGLNKFDPERNCFKRISLPGEGFPAKYSILCIVEEKNGPLWLGTSKGLFLLADPKTNRFRSAHELGLLPAYKNKIVYTIFKDTEGFLWIGTGNGLIRVKKYKTGYEEKIFNSDNTDAASLSDNYITSITEDKLGNLWVATIKGLNLYNRTTGKFSRFFHSRANKSGIINDNVRKIVSDQSGKIWIGTQEGLSMMDPVTKNCRSFQYNAADQKSLSQNSVHSLFEDANGSLWVGTFFGGVNVAHKYTTQFTAWQHSQTIPSISNNVVSSIVADEKNNLWIGTEGGGLNYFDRNTQKFTIYKNDPGNTGSLGSNLVKTVYLDKDKNIWVGTHGGGLNLFDPARQNFRYFLYKEKDSFRHSEIAAILEDSEGKLWIGKHRGINIFQRNKTELKPSDYEGLVKDLQTKNISALFEDSKKNIWIGSLEGLYLFERNRRSLSPIIVKSKTSVANINCIQEDSYGNIWIGLHYNGVAMYDRNRKNFVFFTRKDGLPNDNVLGILEDEHHNLWFSTSNGLAKFNPIKKSIQTYTSSDGLAGNEFNYNAFFKNLQGEMFFGGINGFTSFFPDKIERNEHTAPLVFTGLKIFNTPVGINDQYKILDQDISLTNKLEFRHNQNSFTLDFSLLNFIKPGKNKYAYKLEGISKEWTEVTMPSASFTNLAEGDYTFLVKGANNDGVWSEPGRMQISILPPFWKTWWAYTLYTVLAGIILFFITRFFYVRALLQRDQELQQAKLNFFTNISHEIRTHLTLIMAPVEKMQKENLENTVLTQQLVNVKNNSNRLLKLVSELMDFRKAETNNLNLHIASHDLISFLNEIYVSFEELSLAKNIKLSFVHDTSELKLFFDKEQLEKVIFNLITNAFKFTQDGGRISLHVETRANKVNIHVTDNGKGIAPEFLGKLFTNFFQANDHTTQNTGYGIGLALSKTIVELHKGTLKVESEPGTLANERRTCFTVTLLKGNKHFAVLQQQKENLLATDRPPDDRTIPVATALIPPFTLSRENPATLLIVEDNAELRSLIKETLQEDYQVIECVDGLSGWQTAVEQIPDLIISDVMMPEMDGFTLCKKLKSDERTSHIPVILLTAKSSQTDHVSGLTTGADIYLTKPFSVQVLELSVRNQLATREIMRQKFSKQFILQPQNISVNPIDEQFLDRLVQVIEEHMDKPEFGVEMLSTKMAMSQSVLYKKIKALTGQSVNDFTKSIRLKKAALILQQRQHTVYEVGYMVGFNDRKYFSKEFKKQFGKTPSEFIQAENGIRN